MIDDKKSQKGKVNIILVLIIIIMFLLIALGIKILMPNVRIKSTMDIFLYIWMFGTLFMPYIIGIILSAIVIWLIRKKLIGKDKKLKILIYAMIIIFCVLLFRKLGYSAMLYVSAKPDKVYTEMKEINDSERLIGLSKDEVVTLLGKPLHKSTDNSYIYDAGKITNYLFFGEREFYDFFVWFDENDRVKSTSIQLPRGG